MAVDLNSYLFPIIEYDPTENPRGVVTAEEWNTILNLLKHSANYTSKSLQSIVGDLYTKSSLVSRAVGNDGSRLIGVDLIPGVQGTNVNEVLRNLKSQIDAVSLGDIPDGSLTSEKLANNLNFRGTQLTFNNKAILTVDHIVNTLANNEINKVPTVKILNDALNTKQNLITIGSEDPNQNTPGNIYLQFKKEE